ncbi:hypothetical protein GM418_30040 [Maribellus comscasis]|uniref:DoxX family protein n=1 Tax=Maribellus comscasis TaxID=2681766 RepID=A0A6I6K819_9BACT|nr:DoxX family protein [Maribellus comscasis]QGY47753.1 hypothetical protein GM418_30040 [Maribellus comscasis]
MNRIKKVGRKLYWVPSLLMALDALIKFFSSPYLEELSQIVPKDKIVWIAIIELCIVPVFLFENTQLIGLLLVFCFWGGAMGVNLNHDYYNYLPIGILFLFSISMLFRNSSSHIKIT